MSTLFVVPLWMKMNELIANLDKNIDVLIGARTSIEGQYVFCAEDTLVLLENR